MIKKLLSISLITATLAANAQQITNAGFETWASTSGGPSAPTSWGTLDQAVDGLVGPTSFVTKSTSPNSGSFAAQVATQTTPLGTLPGALVYGAISLVNLSSVKITGQPYTSNPTSVTYYVKGTVIAGDSAPSIVLLTKWNTALAKRDTIAAGYDFVNNSISSATYTARTFPIYYQGAGAPDTIMYIISSSVHTSSVTPGTSITVDDISFSGNVAGITSVRQAQNNTVAYPNPAVNQITLTSSNEKAKFASVYDLTGRMISKHELLNKAVTVDLNTFQNGMYIYMITDESNHTLNTSKFSVSK